VLPLELIKGYRSIKVCMTVLTVTLSITLKKLNMPGNVACIMDLGVYQVYTQKI
jgi:hypothetical protein